MNLDVTSHRQGVFTLLNRLNLTQDLPCLGVPIYTACAQSMRKGRSRHWCRAKIRRQILKQNILFFLSSSSSPLQSRLWNSAVRPAFLLLLFTWWYMVRGRGWTPNKYQPNSFVSLPLLLGSKTTKNDIMNVSSIVRWITWVGSVPQNTITTKLLSFPLFPYLSHPVQYPGAFVCTETLTTNHFRNIFYSKTPLSCRRSVMLLSSSC